MSLMGPPALLLCDLRKKELSEAHVNLAGKSLVVTENPHKKLFQYRSVCVIVRGSAGTVQAFNTPFSWASTARKVRKDKGFASCVQCKASIVTNNTVDLILL